jgi:microcystin-dependent protein
MGLLEDINSGKYNLVLFVVLFVIAFHQYWYASSYVKYTRSTMQNRNKKTEPMAELDISPQIKEAVKQQYVADVEAIRNLAEVSTKLQKGGLTIPGNLTVTGSFNYLPKGTIVAWTGTTAPEGWALCNGQNGTPNLQGRFVLGWNPGGGKHGKVPGTDYNQLNGVGGDQTNKLTVGEMPAHAHDMDPSGDHTHGQPVGDGGHPARGWFASIITDRHHSWINTGGAGNHRHTIKNSGGNEEHNNMPPYWILAYIMKL